MTQNSDQFAALTTALDAAHTAIVHAKSLTSAFCSTAVEPPVEAQFNAPSTAEILATWRAQHRSGHPAKIDLDSELRAFILARIDFQTYAEVVAAVAETFPPERHISLSGLQRWWSRHRPAIAKYQP